MIFEWLVNYLIHSTLLLGLATLSWLVPRLRDAAVQDVVWKAALLGGLLTATMQTISPLGSLVRLQVASPAPSTLPVARAVETDGLPARKTGEAFTQARASVPTTSTRPISIAIDARRLASWLWTFAALGMLLGLGRSLLAQRRLLADRRPLRWPLPDAISTDLPGLDAVTISSSPHIDNPLITIRGEIVVPEDFVALPAEQQRAALAHELGHLTRRDPLWRVLVELINAVLFVQPLNRVARLRLSRCAELLSDRHAVQVTGDRRALAKSLAWFASARQSPLPAISCAMIGRGSLTNRIRHLLEDSPMSFSSTRPLWGAAMVTLIAAAIALPGISAGGASENRHQHQDHKQNWRGTSINVLDRGSHSEISLSHRDADRSIKLKAEGQLEFAADDSDLVSLGDDGYFDLEVRRGERRNRVEIRDDGGSLQHRYWVDGKERPFDADGRRWFAEILPEVFRLTGINAEARVERILSRGGVGSVLAEIGLIESDRAARVYTTQLSRQAQLDTAQLQILLETLRQSIASDLELRLALSGLMEHQELSVDNWATLIEASRMIGSDLERRLTLADAAAAMPTNDRLLDAYVAAVTHIGSDLESRLALQAIGEHLGAADQRLLIRLIEATTAIGSDLEQRLALRAIAPGLHDRDALQAYIGAADSIGSDLEARLALRPLLDASPPPAVVATLATAAGASIESDHDLRLLLSAVLDDYSDHAAVRQAVIDATETIGSEYERNLLLSRLAR